MKVRDTEEFKACLVRTHTILKDEGEITLSADMIGSSHELEVLWVHMLTQGFPCTMHDVHVALINYRKRTRKGRAARRAAKKPGNLKLA